MKKRIVVTMSALIFFSCGCSQNCNNEAKTDVQSVAQNNQTSIETNSITTKPPIDDSKAKSEDHEIRDALGFLDVKWFITMDPKYDENKYRFCIYIQRVEVTDSKETEVMVGSVTQSLKSGNTLDATIIAEKPFVDSVRADGPVCQEKQSWWQYGKEYTGSSVIKVCLDELSQKYKISEEEMELNKRYILYSDFEG